jgi:predicted TIM-barrel fold metal-dependent hydrolase
MKIALVLTFLLIPALYAQRVNPQLAAEIARIKAVDNHAHPVIPSGTDRDFDALPVDNMEPSSDPVRLRPGAPETVKAAKALYGGTTKEAVKRREGAKYPAWVLDRLGIDVMLANRVAMGQGIVPPRFRWVSYVDALIFPLDNSVLAAANSDRKSFFAFEDKLLKRYYQECGVVSRPATLDEYLRKVVTPTLERQQRGGAIAVKFEAAYLRSLDFEKVDKAEAERVYAGAGGAYKQLQDFLFRYIASEAGRLGMAVHLHTMAGAGSYFNVAGANPLLLESVLNDPALRKTNFVMIHGGWPFDAQITPLLEKPNAYLDFSGQTLTLTAPTVARAIREWLEFVPEKVMFATDAYPYSTEMDWEESGWIAAETGRRALAIALTGMLDDGEITYARAVDLARMVLRENAMKLYKMDGN